VNGPFEPRQTCHSQLLVPLSHLLRDTRCRGVEHPDDMRVRNAGRAACPRSPSARNAHDPEAFHDCAIQVFAGHRGSSACHAQIGMRDEAWLELNSFVKRGLSSYVRMASRCPPMISTWPEAAPRSIERLAIESTSSTACARRAWAPRGSETPARVQRGKSATGQPKELGRTRPRLEWLGTSGPMPAELLRLEGGI
jgi:hypothetical protein